MTALDDMLAKADEVLADKAECDAYPRRVLGRHYDNALAAAPDLARALKAVAEALMNVDPYAYHHPDQATTVIAVVTDIRAAIERRLTEGK